MGKLLLHLMSVVLLVALGRLYAWPSWVTAAAVILGAVGVHVIFDRFAGGSRHIGAAAISNDDPLMLAAMAEAKRTWPVFQDLFKTHPKDSLVKFRLTTKSGEIENVWGDLLALAGGTATVYLRTLPVGAADIPDRRMSVSADDIVDWQVMVADGSLRGGYTQQATFRIIERENGVLPREYADQLARYRPVSTA